MNKISHRSICYTNITTKWFLKIYKKAENIILKIFSALSIVVIYLLISFMYMTSPTIPVMNIVANSIPAIAPINVKANGKYDEIVNKYISK